MARYYALLEDCMGEAFSITFDAKDMDEATAHIEREYDESVGVLRLYNLDAPSRKSRRYRR